MHEKMIDLMEELFVYTDRDSLRRSLNQVFFNYLLNNQDSLPENFETITSDFYSIISFLDKVDMQTKSKSR